jgi:carboxypeptidase Q
MKKFTFSLATLGISSFTRTAAVAALVVSSLYATAQPRQGMMPQQQLDPIVQKIVEEASNNSQLKVLAHELLDVVGPRLVGTPPMDHAHQWAIETFAKWGIPAKNHEWGKWRGWERGISHIDMVYPRIKTLYGTQLAWSPTTGGKAIEGEVVTLPDVADSTAFKAWLKTVKGKYVLLSVNPPSGRPDYNWKENATPESYEKSRRERLEATQAFNDRVRRTGVSIASLPSVLEDAGAAGIVQCDWSGEFGSNKIFGAKTKKVPTVDLLLEDYGVLYRLAESGKKPRIKVQTESRELGTVPVFNTIAEIKGTEFPDEYVILSAHFDSWEGGSGATDNGTGTIAMMEVARILKKIMPNPKRTIIIGLWGSEEQGLNGSRAFVIDNPTIVQKTQAVFNLDNGTGRVTSINGSGFVHAYDFVGRWMGAAPSNITSQITTTFPGSPAGGSSDHASFVAAGIPAFMLSAHPWGYSTITWHTNLDTYDKLVFDDLIHNVILTATMAYKASEEPTLVNREQRVLPAGRNGQPGAWPAVRSPTRLGGF